MPHTRAERTAHSSTAPTNGMVIRSVGLIFPRPCAEIGSETDGCDGATSKDTGIESVTWLFDGRDLPATRECSPGKVGFADDPDGGQGIDPEVGISWGSFQIWIEGRNLCAHQEGDGQVDSVHWYILPLIEWFVRNWNPLLHEERLPVQNEYDTAWESLRSTRFPPWVIENDEEKASAWESEWQRWWTRHALRSASEGGLFPDVLLRRLRDSVEVSWGPARSAGMPPHFSFLEPVQGVSRLTPGDVAEPLHEVLCNASAYLLSLAPNSHRIAAFGRITSRLEDR